MKKALLGKKLGMTQIFNNDGKVIPVTVIEAGPCTVVQVKTKDADGYDAVQLGFGEVKTKHINKPESGHFAKSKIENKKHLRLLFVFCLSSFSLCPLFLFSGLRKRLSILEIKPIFPCTIPVPAKTAYFWIMHGIRAMRVWKAC